MTSGEAINWLINISADIGKAEHRDLWHYEQALYEIREMLESAQPEQAVKDCRNCKHGKYNDYHDTYFCYNAEDCSNWDKWETSAQPEIIRCGKCTHKDKKIDYCHRLGITICECDYCSFAERRPDGSD